MIKNKTVTFTPDEIDAIEKVYTIDCNDIACSECPFNYGNGYCVINDLKRDLLRIVKIAGITTPTL